MPRTIKLKKPIVYDAKGAGGEMTKETVTEMTFRDEIVSGDLRGVKASELGDPPVEVLMRIASRLSGQPEVVMAKLGVGDTGEIGSLIIGFMGAGEPSSGTAA